MIRVLTIDGNRSRAQKLAMECLEHGVAVRMAESLCEGVRYLLDSPVSLVLAEAGMVRMAGPDQARLFDAVAPGVPVVAAGGAGTRGGDRRGLALKGLHGVGRPCERPALP